MSIKNSNTRLVFSTDPKDNQQCAKCKQLQVNCTCVAEPSWVQSRNFIAKFRIEKSGRGGKTVTVIDALPKIELFLKDLCKELKASCGVGGSYFTDGKDGVIEIQGDKRDAIKKIFEKKGFKFKG
ncbi:MAG: translation initiation factor [Pseudobdellovibrionaceae bacterium]